MNAHTLENQVARLLSHTHAEVRDLGSLLKQAALNPAFDVHREGMQKLVDEICAAAPGLAERAEQELLRSVRVAPTLVKYADPSQYEIQSRAELRRAAS